MARVAVIGAGLGGLSVALRLAVQGHAVTVCEQAPEVGGKVGVYRRDGFTFDTGPSLLTLPAVYRDLFLATGEPLESVLELVPVDPVFHYRFADGTELDMPNAPPSRAAAAWDAALGRGAGEDWSALLARAGRIWDLTRGPFLESPLDGTRTLARLGRRTGDVGTVAPWRTLRGIGARYLRHPHQRTVLDRYATYTGSDPRRAPAAMVTVPYVEQAFGAWYVRGGLRRLADVVADRARERGVAVRTGAEVRSVVLDAGRARGVRLTDGELLPADLVVSDADAACLYADMLPPRVAGTATAARGVRRATPSLSGFVMMLALSGRTPGLRHHSVLFPEDYDDEFDAVFGSGRRARSGCAPVPDPTVYVSAPDDPATRPDPDTEAWFVLVNAARHVADDAGAARTATRGRGGGVDWTAPGLSERYADAILEVLARRGIDVRQRVLWREVRTPADLERETRSAGGSIYGTSSNGIRAAFLRPANRSPVPGLFLVGGSSHPGGGLPLVGLSAAIVARLVGRA